MNEQVLVYEIKSSDNSNFDKLFNANRSAFYWNDKAFKGLNIGDFVYVVNTHSKKVLFTKLVTINIPVTTTANETTFTDAGETFAVSGKYGQFIKLSVINECPAPTNWKWKSLGSSETTYLHGPRINTEKSANRILNINQLKELSSEANYNSILNNCLLNFDPTSLIPEIVNAIASANTQTIINQKEFYFLLAKNKLNEFEAINYPNEVYDNALQLYKNSNTKIDDFVNNIPNTNADEKAILTLCGEVIAYIDLQGGGKDIWNLNDDKRTIARAFVFTDKWIPNLLRFKKTNNDLMVVSPNIYNAFVFLKSPQEGINVLSENHRKLISENLLSKNYNNTTFINDLKSFFGAYAINPINADNLTAAIASVLYNNAVKALWMTDKEEALKTEATNIDLLCAIKTKPFVILAGLSGTGKSREVRALAYQFCSEDLKTENNGKPNNFELIKVKPNWQDSTELLGYESRITGTTRYIATDFIRFLVKAWKHIDTPFFLCLDEMNLAPVEQYFAEFLSVIETRQKDKNNTVITDSLINAQIFTEHNNADFWTSIGLTEQDEDIKTQLKTNGLCIPQNLIVIGTVNMDETTHSFSRKVLDRAMTIEMNTIDLNSGLEKTSNTWVYPLNPSEASLILGNYTLAKDVIDELGENTKVVIDYLEAINNILSDSPFKIAYRVRDEFLIYLTHFLPLNDNVNKALDNMTLMKILPRIEGDETKTKVILKSLLSASETEELTNTKTKVSEMLKKLDNYHYTSFWN